MVEKDMLLGGSLNTLEKIGIQLEERFIEKILKRQKNVGVMLVIKLGIMLMNVLINLIKRRLK